MSTDLGFSLAAYPPLTTGAGRRRLEEIAQARGHSAGYTAGLRAARTEIDNRLRDLEAAHAASVLAGQARVDDAVRLLQVASRALDARTLPPVTDATEVLAASAFALAEAVIGHELTDHVGSARAAVARATGGVDGSFAQTVRMHPDDVAVLDHQALATSGVAIVADAGMDRGDAVADLPDGYLDARIGTALDRARSALLGVAR